MKHLNLVSAPLCRETNVAERLPGLQTGNELLGRLVLRLLPDFILQPQRKILSGLKTKILSTVNVKWKKDKRFT